MYNIVIGIPTYKRPLMLKKLILSIIECNINKTLIKDINIIVVDNDINKTAEKIVKELTDRYYGVHKLNYYSYPVKGLSNVRNELFNRAFEYNPDYIVCIDDDEFATSDWLNQLLSAITAIKAEITLGPVIPVFENKISPYIAYWFKYQNLVNYQRVDFFWTGNFIICANFLLKNKIKFDERFNSSGSEDSYFGVTALKAGAKICWASNAIVYETIPNNRAKLKWLIKRSYNSAITFTYILKLEKNNFGLLKKTLISVAYFLSGGMALVVIPFPFRWKYWGILKFSESIGGFAGLFGIQYHEYAKDR
jgi:cellulose synthase/poly-beta-1,6-N-acetylglucosamine synthase-like glycosyltransferase